MPGNVGPGKCRYAVQQHSTEAVRYRRIDTMSPLSTPKYRAAVERLQALGLIPAALALLADKGPEALYRELSRRGLVWSTDLQKWRKSRKPRKMPIAVVKVGYLDHLEMRLIVRSNEVDEAIAEFSAAMLNAGYEITRVSVHTSRNPGELLVYCHVHQNGGRNG